MLRAGARMLVPEQPALDVERQGVAAVYESAQPVGCHHAMARNHQRDAVSAARAAYRARGAAEPARDVLVGKRLAARYATDLFPYLALELRAAILERQLENVFRVVEVSEQLFAGALGGPRQRGQGRYLRRQIPDVGEQLAAHADAEHRERGGEPRLEILQSHRLRNFCSAITASIRAMPKMSAHAFG